MNQQNPNKQPNSSSGGYTNTYNTNYDNNSQQTNEDSQQATTSTQQNHTNTQQNPTSSQQNQTSAEQTSSSTNQDQVNSESNKKQDSKLNSDNQTEQDTVTTEPQDITPEVVEEPVETEEQKQAKKQKLLEAKFDHLISNLKYVDYFDKKYEQNINVLQELIKGLDEQELNTYHNKVLLCVQAIRQKYNKAKQTLADKSNDPNIVKVRENISTFRNTINNLEQTKSRLNTDKDNVKKYGSEKLIKNAIKPFIQNFDNGLNQLIKFKKQNEENQNLSLFIEKLQGVKASLFANLDKNNCKTFGQVNDEFDPNIHDALGAIPIENVPGSTHNRIIQVSSQGFKLHDRVVVPAGVLVAIDYSKN